MNIATADLNFRKISDITAFNGMRKKKFKETNVDIQNDCISEISADYRIYFLKVPFINCMLQ